ncbi:MAG TPA: zinc ribbon domain-containing protein [Bryobacteraceae bacterium]|nr:zinc ribbon domain-containing protein [Bryobacteraceae bacterium]
MRRISPALSDLVTISITSLLAIAAIIFVLRVRPQDIPPVEKPSPTARLEERKAAIYENLRDLQFEYRVGKLSDQDYQSTKIDLQKELAAVLAEMDKLKGIGGSETKGAPLLETKGPAPIAAPSAAEQVKQTARECPHCGAKFERDLKFCGECGKAMTNA